ncbi:DUF5681 domain-containing protein [Lichenibacterium dinghuense]|uniref:DUF5681 domain-containing protein n=1 Tax=Lichenibacterium dinghuense TaxID=2895977 RepID=UPI001F465C12|nr:DUF5681 domain-containing protein [Lichenibacterium sp. 6Y81]
MKPRKPTGDYEVGYGKPPKSGQFRKGQSGNPKGRTKGSLDLKTVLTAALQESVPVTNNGRSTRKSKFDLWIIGLINRAVKGDAKAGMMLLALLGRTGVALSEPEVRDGALDAADDAMFADYLQKLGGPGEPEQDAP